MELNMESFLATEKKRLQTEKQQLSARSSTISKPNNTRNRSHKSVKQNGGDTKEFPAARALRNTEFINDVKCNRSNKTVLEKRLIQQVFAADGTTNTRVNDLRQPPPTTVTSSAYRATNRESSVVDTTTHTELKPSNDLDTTFTRLPAEDELSDDFETFANDLDLGNISSARGSTGDCGNATIVKESAADGFVGESVREIGWSKAEKDLANNMEVRSATNAVAPQQTSADSGRLRRTRNEDDMEQWVSDTFYSYFPGFNNEYQKRQNYLRERQLEYQQNLLKHQQQQLTKSNKLKDRAGAATRSPQPSLSTGASTARSSSTAAATSTNTTTNKTDLEIIVNNPNYAPKYSVSVVASSGAAARPGSTRHKLLQDLQHTELANIVGGDGVAERNRQSAESDSARKKDYQRDLMQQIEEKRRSIEALREEERRQEEALTRRLQEQLKTIRLEEELEKEKLRVEKLRFNTEQKRLMREQLLAKLDNDSHILKEAKYTEIKARIDDREPCDAVQQSSTTSSHVAAGDKARSQEQRNKVYKYFSNSARREFRHGRAALDESHDSADFALLDAPQQQVSSVERECFHLSEKVCPKCAAPLRTFDATCLRCQRGLSLRLKRSGGGAAELHVAAAGDDDARHENHENHTDSDAVSRRRSYSLVCSKCDRLYSLCPSCVVKSDVCRACHRQRNVCMNCRRSLCSFCLEEVACGRDTEQTHVNEQHAEEEQLLDNVNKVYASDGVSEDAGQRSADEESSFQVLELNYAVPKTSHDYDDNGDFASDNNSHRQIHNNINNKNNNNHHRETTTSKRPPPYSLNIERNSIFHPNYEASTSVAFEQLPKIADKNLNLSFDVDAAVHSEHAANLDRVRKETDKRLSRYLKNYGDLTKYSKEKGIKQQHHLRCLSESHDRSTQTTPLTAARRDVVLYEGHNLSMPLLREMPRMTRREAQKLQARRKQPPATNTNSSCSSQMMDNLKRRWEIPAVQKHSISTSPPVLTQVGAMRKQLQADRLLSEDF